MTNDKLEAMRREVRGDLGRALDKLEVLQDALYAHVVDEDLRDSDILREAWDDHSLGFTFAKIEAAYGMLRQGPPGAVTCWVKEGRDLVAPYIRTEGEA